MDITKLKKSVVKDIDSSYKKLRDLSRKIHDNPETAMEERRASAWLCQYLEKNGFTVEKGICDLPTAFRGKYGRGRPVIAFLAEYDALPKIGHGCGHNLIATSSVAAGVACREAVNGLGGSIIVYGTPGEEIAGGKAIMADRGAFRDADVAMITHPGGGNHVMMNALACQNLDVEFFGKAAHAAADPETGINALAAMILSYNAIDALRQHIKEKARIHGIITDGGEVANVVPAHTAASFIVRAADNEYLDALEERVLACFAGAAAATGAELKYKWDAVRYAAMKNNLTMTHLFQENMAALGYRIPMGDEKKFSGSTDVGNVSQIIPSIHPTVSIATEKVLIHSPEFARAAATESAFRRMMNAAKAMAMTTVDILADPEALKKIQAEFKRGER
jgi:amidohydrolase